MVRAYTLTSGRSTKCRSCVPRETLTKPFKGDPITHVFSGMWQRCYDKNHKSYDRYGGRGIHICDEWLNDRQTFYRWAYDNGYEKGMSIERIDIDGPYSPENCTFIPMAEQAVNKSTTRLITIDGITNSMAEWCRIYDINYDCVRSRINKGMDPVKAITTPSGAL